MNDFFSVYGKKLESRMLIGSSLYPSPEIMQETILASRAEIVTVSLRRETANETEGAHFWDHLKNLNINILPNTAGCFSVAEAVTTAHMARNLFGTKWIKLEVLGDRDILHPDPVGMIDAARTLIADGFEVFPFITEDFVVAKRLVDLGCEILMPWGSPIGTGQGLLNPYALNAIRERFPEVTLIVDAGIGRPSDAVQAMELGFDGVLLNTAVASAIEPIQMGSAFRLAIESGRLAYKAGAMSKRALAAPSTSFDDMGVFS
jgi:thiazole synthase